MSYLLKMYFKKNYQIEKYTLEIFYLRLTLFCFFSFLTSYDIHATLI